MKGAVKAGFAVFCIAAVTACSSQTVRPTRNDARAPAKTIRYVTLEEIAESLPADPVVAGFDIDDTVLFSTPGFHYALANHDGPGGRNRYGNSVQEILNSELFWNDMNGNFDRFSIPKQSGTALVRMHVDRGDRIVFITARDSSRISIVPKILMQALNLDKQPEVVFTCSKPKRRSMKDKGVAIYYGDSDSDILAADSADARAVRILRSPLSNNKTSYTMVGQYGEPVMKDSEN